MKQGDRVIGNRCRVTTCPRWRVAESQKKSKYVKCDEAVRSKSEKEASADGSPGNESSILVHVYVQYGVILCYMHYRRSQLVLVLTGGLVSRISMASRSLRRALSGSLAMTVTSENALSPQAKVQSGCLVL